MLLNLTPHPVKIVSDDQVVTIQPSGWVARVKVDYRPVETDLGVPVVQATFGEVEVSNGSETMPFEAFVRHHASESRGVIVSRVVAQALPKGLGINLFVPATGPGFAVRDADGRIQGVKALEIV